MLLDEGRRVEEGVGDVEHLRRGGRGRLLDLAVVEGLHALISLLVLELMWRHFISLFFFNFQGVDSK